MDDTLLFYFGLYGLAGVLCLIGYFYALIDNQLTGRANRMRQISTHQRSAIDQSHVAVQDHQDFVGDLQSADKSVKEEEEQSISTPIAPLQSRLVESSRQIIDSHSSESINDQDQCQDYDERRRQRRDLYAQRSQSPLECPQDEMEIDEYSEYPSGFNPIGDVSDLEEVQDEDDEYLTNDLLIASFLHDLDSQHLNCNPITNLDIDTLGYVRANDQVPRQDSVEMVDSEQLQADEHIKRRQTYSGAIVVDSVEDSSQDGETEMIRHPSSRPTLTHSSSERLSIKGPIPKLRRFSLRSKKSFDEHNEIPCDALYSRDQQLNRVGTLYTAIYSIENRQTVHDPPTLDLCEGQRLRCLDVDNPDLWVVDTNCDKGNCQSKDHLPDSIGRACSVGLSSGASDLLGLKRSTGGRRNSRVAFREQVISIANKQQEVKIKRRYAISELIDDEVEYSRALKPLHDLLQRLTTPGQQIGLADPDREGVSVALSNDLRSTLNSLLDSLDSIVEFTKDHMINQLTQSTSDPNATARCFLNQQSQFEHYTNYLLHADALFTWLHDRCRDLELTRLQFVQSNPTNSSTVIGSLSHLIDLIDLVPRHLASYRSVLLDLARYADPSCESGGDIQRALVELSHVSRQADEQVELWRKVEGIDDSQVGKHKSGLMPTIIRMSDLRVCQHSYLDPKLSDLEINETGRIILLPNMLIFLQTVHKNDTEPVNTWKVSWMCELRKLRMGMQSPSNAPEHTIDLWNVVDPFDDQEGNDLRQIYRIQCPNPVSRLAWQQDLSRALSQQVNSSQLEVDPDLIEKHQLAEQCKLKSIMTDVRREQIIEEVGEEEEEEFSKAIDDEFVDALDESVRNSNGQNDGSSGSYHTAQEFIDDESDMKAKDGSTTLYESFTTLDGVTTPFGEDQRSLLEGPYSLDSKDRRSSNPTIPEDASVKRVTVKGNEQLQLSASFTISGPVAYEVQWFHNQAPIQPDLDADMILTASGTRLLIGRADPVKHAGSYSCRCRLFEGGVETSVYFLVNVEPVRISGIEEEDEEQHIEPCDVGPDKATLERVFVISTVNLSSQQPSKDVKRQAIELRATVVRRELLTVLCDLGVNLDQFSWDKVKVEWFDHGHIMSSANSSIAQEGDDRIFALEIDNQPSSNKDHGYTCRLTYMESSSGKTYRLGEKEVVVEPGAESDAEVPVMEEWDVIDDTEVREIEKSIQEAEKDESKIEFENEINDKSQEETTESESEVSSEEKDFEEESEQVLESTREESSEGEIIEVEQRENIGVGQEQEFYSKYSESDDERLQREQEAEQARLKEAEEQARKEAEEAERLQREQEAEQARLKEAEEQARKEAEEAERLQREQEAEQARLKEAEEQARKEAEEAERLQREQEAEQARLKEAEEQARKEAEEAERLQREQEAEQARLKEAEEQARKEAEEAERLQREQEAEQARLKEAEEQARKEAEEAERLQREQEAEQARLKEAEEQARKEAEEAERLQREQEAEQARLKEAEEQARKEAEEAERLQREQEAEQARLKEAEEQARKEAEEAERLQREQEAEQARLKEAEEQARKEAEEAERLQREQEAEQARLKEAEEQARKEAEEAERLQREQEAEQARLKEAEEQARKEAEEAERLQREQEAEQARLKEAEEQARKEAEEAERLQREQEAEQARLKEAEEQARKEAEEAERLQREQEAEQARLKEAEEQARKEAEEAERLQREQEAEQARLKEAEEQARKEAEEAERLQREQEAEQARLKEAEEQARKEAEEAERLQREQEAEQARLKEAEEQARKEAEEAERLQREQEAEQARLKEAEEQARKEAEEAERLQREQEAEAQNLRDYEAEVVEKQRKDDEKLKKSEKKRSKRETKERNKAEEEEDLIKKEEKPKTDEVLQEQTGAEFQNIKKKEDEGERGMDDEKRKKSEKKRSKCEAEEHKKAEKEALGIEKGIETEESRIDGEREVEEEKERKDQQKRRKSEKKRSKRDTEEDKKNEEQETVQVIAQNLVSSTIDEARSDLEDEFQTSVPGDQKPRLIIEQDLEDKTELTDALLQKEDQLGNKKVEKKKKQKESNKQDNILDQGDQKIVDEKASRYDQTELPSKESIIKIPFSSDEIPSMVEAEFGSEFTVHINALPDGFDASQIEVEKIQGQVAAPINVNIQSDADSTCPTTADINFGLVNLDSAGQYVVRFKGSSTPTEDEAPIESHEMTIDIRPKSSNPVSIFQPLDNSITISSTDQKVQFNSSFQDHGFNFEPKHLGLTCQSTNQIIESLNRLDRHPINDDLTRVTLEVDPTVNQIQDPTTILMQFNVNADELVGKSNPCKVSLRDFVSGELTKLKPLEYIYYPDRHRFPSDRDTTSSDHFLTSLPSVTKLVEGERGEMTVQFDSRVPLDRVEWQFNNKPIIPEFSTDFMTWRSDNQLSLILPTVRTELAGSYGVRAETEDGKIIESKTQLKVVSSETTSTKKGLPKPTPVDGIKPVFTRKLYDLQAESGESIRLMARVLAEPTPVIVWKHNGEVLDGDCRRHLYTDGIITSLTIREVEPVDRGTYSCSAANIVGKTETEALLTVDGLSDPIDGLWFDDHHPMSGGSIQVDRKVSALPPAVKNFGLVDYSPDWINLSWDRVKDDPDVTYIVEVSKDGGRWWSPICQDLTQSSITLSSDQASPLQPLALRIVTSNRYGLGPPSSQCVKVPVRAALPEMLPVKPSIEFDDAASILIKWSPAIVGRNVGGISRTELSKSLLGHVTYSIEIRQGSSGSDWSRIASNQSDLSYVHHLEPGVSSAIRIRAHNKYGESDSTSPIAIAYLDPNSLAPSLDYNVPPWVSIDRQPKGQIGLTVHWKEAYMPAYCSSCVAGLDPLYRIEYRQSRVGPWTTLVDGLTDSQDGYRLPTELTNILINEVMKAPSHDTVNPQMIELRVACSNRFGDSGTTRPCRLTGDQLFRGQQMKQTVALLDQPKDQLDELLANSRHHDVVSIGSEVDRLSSRVVDVSPSEGVTLEWDPFQGKRQGHGQYKIERFRSNRWLPVETDDYIFGESYQLDVKPGSEEQMYRIISLQQPDQDSNQSGPCWFDAHKHLRIAPLDHFLPHPPTQVFVRSIPPTDKQQDVANLIFWNPPVSDDDPIGDWHELRRYRVEARSTQSDLSPWRQVGEVEAGGHDIVDAKSEPGSQLVYRVTPVNQVGEGASVLSTVVTTPLRFSTLDGCQDLRYSILGPRCLQLRWRPSDSLIDALGHQSTNTTTTIAHRGDHDDLSDRLSFDVEQRLDYAGDWHPVVESITGGLTGKTCINDSPYLVDQNNQLSYRVIARVDGHQPTRPSRPILIGVTRDNLVPDYSMLRPSIHIESLDAYVISWDVADVQEIYTDHILGLTTPQVLHAGTKFVVEIQHENQSEWEQLSPIIQESCWIWTGASPLKQYHFRVVPINQFGAGFPSRHIKISPQVVIPDLRFVQPAIKQPDALLLSLNDPTTSSPELVWQLPKTYTIDRTLTPVTYEVQVRGCAGRSGQDGTSPSEQQQGRDIWRILAPCVKRNRLSLSRLDPRQEYWLRVVPVTDYGKGHPSRPVKKMASVTLSRPRHVRIGSITDDMVNETGPATPKFADPITEIAYAPLGGRVTLTSKIKNVMFGQDTRFDWYFGNRPIEPDEKSTLHNRMSRFHQSVNKAGDTASCSIDNLTEIDFGVYSCQVINIHGTDTKEFVLKRADAPVLLEIPLPIVTLTTHSPLHLPCLVDALPSASVTWTRDSKRVTESHRTRIDDGSRRLSIVDDMDNDQESVKTINASLSIGHCLLQDAGLYTVKAENMAGQAQTSCMVRVQDVPEKPEVSVRWTDIEKYYYVLGRLGSNTRLLIDKKTNRECAGKLFDLTSPEERLRGAKEFACLSRSVQHDDSTSSIILVDAIVSDNVLVLVTERLTGPKLMDAVLSCPSWSKQATRVIIRQLVRLVADLHANSFVHLNIRPDNLQFSRSLVAFNTLSSQSSTKLASLLNALSPLVSDTTTSSSESGLDKHKMNIYGSPLKLTGFSRCESTEEASGDAVDVSGIRNSDLSPFSAPEMARMVTEDGGEGSVPTSSLKASDMWSVGVITHLLLVGKLPFNQPEDFATELANWTTDSSIHQLEECEYVSEDASDFVWQLLQLDPEKRLSAMECLQRPWLSNSNTKDECIEYPLQIDLKKTQQALNQLQHQSPDKSSRMSTSISGSLVPGNLSSYLLAPTSERHSVGVRLPDHYQKLPDRIQHIFALLKPSPSTGWSSHREDCSSSLSNMSSRASSIPSDIGACDFAYRGDPDNQDVSIVTGGGHDSASSSQSFPTQTTTIVSSDDASEEIVDKLLRYRRQDTLTIDDNGGDQLELLEDRPSSRPESQVESIIAHSKPPIGPVKRGKTSRRSFKNKPPAAATLPLFTAPLRDAYFNIHSRQVRFSCQLASTTSSDGQQPPPTVAAWYLAGQLLSDGPGVALGAEPGGWLWMSLVIDELPVLSSGGGDDGDRLSDLDGAVIECVIRNRAGSARSRARMIKTELPKPPGRPGVVRLNATEALITWASTNIEENSDVIYRIDAKVHGDHGPVWLQLGFTVDTRFLATSLTPSTSYRVRVTAGSVNGWSSYSIASSEFRTPPATDQSQILPEAERRWILGWRQSKDTPFALSDHPIAVNWSTSKQEAVDLLPPSIPESASQSLARSPNGLVPDLDTLVQLCRPERVLKRGQFTTLILARSHPSLSEPKMISHHHSHSPHQLAPPSLPCRLLIRVERPSATSCSLARLRQLAAWQANLNTACGSTPCVDDFFSLIDQSASSSSHSLLFTSHRHLLPIGWSANWLGNDAAKPTNGCRVENWIPGGLLVDVLASRQGDDYSEWAVAQWTSQLLGAFRWLHNLPSASAEGCGFGWLQSPHCVLVARRTSTLPDVVLALGGSSTTVKGDSGDDTQKNQYGFIQCEEENKKVSIQYRVLLLKVINNIINKREPNVMITTQDLSV